MAGDLRIERVAASLILPLRERILSTPGSPIRAFSGDNASTSRHWAAISDGLIIGCVSVIQKRGWALRGMAVCAEHRLRGLGASMLRVVHQAVDQPMWCNSRLEAVPFYERQGWTTQGPVFIMDNQLPHQRMIWAKLKTAHAVSSPSHVD